MIGYECGRCPLAFEVGYYGYWDQFGGCVKYVCRHCGTMHKTEHISGQADLLYSLDGPIRRMVEETVELAGETHTTRHLSISDSDWRLIGPLPTADKFLHELFIVPERMRVAALDQAVCGHCQRVGGLVSGTWPCGVDDNPKWPAVGDNCPVCNGPLDSRYMDTIN